ncbi:Protein TONNEAU 1b [Camellia lanceoleosa]|uniref:Protein TONNEAU 1b n=1 Tax=Camellia lanceoleosa TaxID=1840588 RepID=A0ACC0G7I1_9ERIC|nr:Protein TONNEAU 1b [Camellia lanceoleosa]
MYNICGGNVICYGEAEALTDEIEEDSQIFGEVLRIKKIIDNCQDEVSSIQLRDDLLSMLVSRHKTTGLVLTWTTYLLSKITILVAAEGLHELATINGYGDLKEALQKLASFPSRRTLAELRASVFEAIEEEDRTIEKEEGLPPALLGSCNDHAKQLHASPSGYGTTYPLPGYPSAPPAPPYEGYPPQPAGYPYLAPPQPGCQRLLQSRVPSSTTTTPST